MRIPALEIACRTDPGRDPEKQVNEDACAEEATRFGHLLVVCDGMGGHAGGREASQLALRVIRESLAKAPEGTPPRDALAQAIRDANKRVFTMTTPIEHNAAGRPGSTVVAALVHAEGTELAHVGDSRAYLVHGGQIVQLTKDHSMVQRMVDEHLLSPAEAARHPEANKILRALGIAQDVDVEVRAHPVAHVAGDVLILCSDGLSDLVGAEDILAIAGAAPAAQAAGQLVDLANARGGHDNVSVVVARAKETATRPRDLPPTVTEQMGAAPAPHAVAPTVLQTPAPPVVGAAMPGGPPSAPRAPVVAPPPHPGPSPARALAAVAIAIALMGLGAVIYATVEHARERGGRHAAPPAVSDEPLPAPSAPDHVHLVPLNPLPAPSAPESADADAGLAPLAPLAPIAAPDAGRVRRRHF